MFNLYNAIKYQHFQKANLEIGVQPKRGKNLFSALGDLDKKLVNDLANQGPNFQEKEAGLQPDFRNPQEPEEGTNENRYIG